MSDEIPEDYYLKYPNEVKTGGDLLNVVYDEVKQLKAENAALIAALKELIPIAEERIEIAIRASRYAGSPQDAEKVMKQKSAIERAKLLTPNKEPGN